MKLKLISPIPPSINSYLNFKVARQSGKTFVQAYPSTQTTIYTDFFVNYVRDEIYKQGWEKPPKGQLINIHLIFYLDRKRKDPSNFLKVMLDCLVKAGVFVDDDVALTIIDRLYIDKANPRISITLEPSKAVGIFDSAEQFSAFKEKNCDQCKRKQSSCSVLKAILDNRIVDDVPNISSCLKIKPKS